MSTYVLTGLENWAAIAYLNQMGEPSHFLLFQLVIDIWNWCLARQIILHAEYLPGTKNTRESGTITTQQLGTMPVSIRDIELLNGTALHRPVCVQNELPITGLLQLETQSRSQVGGCIFNFIGQEAPFLFPPFCLIGRALSQISREVVDSAYLVAPAWPTQIWYPQLPAMLTGSPILLPTENYLLLSPDQRPHPLQLEGSLCLAYLRQHFEMQGLSPRAAELLIKSWIGNTNDAYNSAWRKWLCWCTERNINPISTTVLNITQFLVDQFDTGLQYRTINTLRSAISTTHPDIEGSPVGSHPLVSRLLRGMFTS